MAQTSAPRRHRMKAALWTFALAAPLIGVTNISPALARLNSTFPGCGITGPWSASTRRSCRWNRAS